MAQTHQVLIVDDHPLFRDALESALNMAFADGADGIHAPNLAEAEQLLSERKFDAILLDLNLPDTEGFAGLSRLRALHPNLPIIVISAAETDETIHTARELGARGYVPKSADLSSLSTALAVTLKGDTWFPETTSDPMGEGHELVRRLATLTPAQKRVLNGLSDGLLNKQIAYEMDISIATVKAHMTAIFRKLGANNRTQALLIYRSATQLDDHSAA